MKISTILPKNRLFHNIFINKSQEILNFGQNKKILMIGNIIFKHLNEQGRSLIIPGLGAFIKRDSGEIIFSGLLTSGDSKFAELIRESEELTVEEASARAERYACEFRDTLNTQKKITIEGLGTLSITPEGKYLFELADTTTSPCEIPLKERIEEILIAGIESDDAPGANTIETSREANEEETEIDMDVILTLRETPNASRKSALRSAIYGEEGRSEDLEAKEKEDIKAEEAAFNNQSREVLNDLYTGGPDTAEEPDPIVQYKPQIQMSSKRRRRRVDWVMIIGIIAFIVVIGVLVYGYIIQKGIDADMVEELLPFIEE